MSSTPFSQPAMPGDDIVDLGPTGAQGPSSADVPSAEGRTATGRGRRRGLVIGAGVLAAGLVGGGASYAVAALGGGGAQPEVSVPSSAIALVRVDLDPSSGQKVNALRFARKFPDVRSQLGAGEDPRKALFDALRSGKELTGSWKADVEPWLGQRAALAIVPGATAAAEPVPVVVLAVTNAGKAQTGLRKVTRAACTVTGGFAVCASNGAVATKAAADARRSSLAKDRVFTKDVAALGGDGVALGWVDLGRAKSALPALQSALAGTTMAHGALGAGALKGRYVAALRFDGPNLELVGRVEGATAPARGGPSGVGALPAGTLAAFGTGGADTVVTTAWKQARAMAQTSGGIKDFDQQVTAVRKQYGIKLPQDISAAVGERAVLAFGGVTKGNPDVALRLSGSPASVAKLVRVANQNASGQFTLRQARAGKDTVVGLTQAYANTVATRSGLGASSVFKTAVPDAKGAQQVLFVDIAGTLRATGSMLGLTAKDKRDLAPLSALGMTSGRDGSASTFRIRLTTR